MKRPIRRTTSAPPDAIDRAIDLSMAEYEASRREAALAEIHRERAETTTGWEHLEHVSLAVAHRARAAAHHARAQALAKAPLTYPATLDRRAA